MLKKSILPLALGLLMAATAACAQQIQGSPPVEGSAPPQDSGEHRGPPNPADIIARLDTDKDGAISKDEAAAAPRMAEHFDDIDTDHDGKVTAAELTAFFANMKPRQQ